MSVVSSEFRTCHSNPQFLKLSVGITSNADLLIIEGLFTQGSRPGRTVGGSVGEVFEMDSSDWSNGIRYHIFDTRPDTEFKVEGAVPHRTCKGTVNVSEQGGPCRRPSDVAVGRIAVRVHRLRIVVGRVVGTRYDIYRQAGVQKHIFPDSLIQDTLSKIIVSHAGLSLNVVLVSGGY